MKLLFSAAEIAKFAESFAPVTSFADADMNKDLPEGSEPSNMTGQMVSDLVELMSKKGLVKENGPVSITVTDAGELCVDINEEFTTEFTGVYFKHVLNMMKPIMALIEVMKVQQKDMEELQTKWFPQPDYTLGEPADLDDFI